MVAYLFYLLQFLSWSLGNLIRRFRRPPDYVLFTLAGDYPTLRPPRGNWIMRRLRPAKVSLQGLAARFRAIAEDERIRGVVLHLRPLAMLPGRLDTLRGMIQSLRAAGKRVVVWSYTYSRSTYYVASAADEILLIPGGSLSSLGLSRRYLFLADALEQVGVRADILQISPYKSAGDTFTRRELSDEVRQMANWLVEAAYEEVQQAIAEGRGVDEEAARQTIDDTPCTDLRAQKLGLVDALVQQEDLADYLQGEDEDPIRLAPWSRARASLRRPRPGRPAPYVAVMGIEGNIVDGHSQRPPFRPPFQFPFILSERAGDLSVVQVARRIRRDKRAKAVVLYVDSGGGSATASESMRAALAKIAEEKPLVVVMGGVAASGGYWVSTPGQVIVAQPNTITGSIGVLSGKFHDTGLLDKLAVNQESIARGEHALIYDLSRPFTEEEREILWAQIERIYDLFLERVSTSREMSREAVDAIGKGRVWTGRQAQANGLVDEMGDLEHALDRARELAGLDERAPVRNYYPQDQTVAPLPETGAALDYLLEGLHALRHTGPLCLCPLIPT